MLKLNTKKIEAEFERLGPEWNQSHLAKKIKMSRQNLNLNWHHTPSLKTVEKIAKVLKIDERDLLI